MSGFPVSIVQHIPTAPSAFTQSGSDYLSNNGEIQVKITKDPSTGANLVQFSRVNDSIPVQWSPRSLKYIGDGGSSDIIYNADNTSPLVINRGQHARYSGHFANVDDRFVVEAGQLKHYVTLNAEQRVPLAFIKNPKLAVSGVLTFDPSYSVVMNGMNMTGKFTCAGHLDIVDADGKLVYTLPQVEAWDQAGNTVTGEYVVNVLANGRLDLTMAIDQSWLASSATVYPVIIDPTVIVSSAYDTSGNGGRKIVRLSNGWIVSCAYSSSYNSGYPAILVYVSQDNGQTWALKTYVSDLNYYILSNGFSVASTGTTVSIIYTYSTSSNGASPRLYCTKFDVTTAAASYSTSSAAVIEDGAHTPQNSYGTGVSHVIDGTGKLWATWCSKNNTYPNSFNIRVSSSTDGGTTWATPTQVTQLNTTNYNDTNPCIVLRSNNMPSIVYVSNQNGSYSIQVATYNGTAWNGVVAYNGGSYAQSNPCAAVDSNDVIHVVWHGTDSTTAGVNEIKYSKSADGGSTWSAMSNLTSDGYAQQSPSITIDSAKNDLYVFWQGYDANVSTSYWNIRKKIYTGGAWGSVIDVTNTAFYNETSPQTLWSKFNMNSSDAVRYMYADSQGAIQYNSIALNSPPNAPTLTAHGNFDATVAQTLAWTFSDPDSGNTQSAYELKIIDTSNGTTVVDTGKVASTSSTYNLPANTLTNGKQYQWEVCTWDNSGAQGPYSSLSTFNTAAAPSVTITNPASGGTVNASSLTVGFSYSDPASNAQQSFEVMLYDSTDATLIEDSGTVNGTGNQYTLQTVLSNTTTYHVKVKATNSQGITSAVADVSFSTSFTPPASSTTTATADNANARIQVSIVNPSGGSTVAYNDLYRSPAGKNQWTRIATGLAVGSAGTPTVFNDYAVASNTAYDYKVTAVGNNGTSTDTIVSNANVGLLRGVWVHDVSNPSGTILHLPYMMGAGGDGSTSNGVSWTPDATTMQFAGRTDPNVEFGEAETYTLTKGKITMLDSDGSWAKLESLLASKPTLCVRDGRGRMLFGACLGYSGTDYTGGTQMDLTITKTSYSMAV